MLAVAIVIALWPGVRNAIKVLYDGRGKILIPVVIQQSTVIESQAADPSDQSTNSVAWSCRGSDRSSGRGVLGLTRRALWLLGSYQI
jgi:hypothetical protein